MFDRLRRTSKPSNLVLTYHNGDVQIYPQYIPIKSDHISIIWIMFYHQYIQLYPNFCWITQKFRLGSDCFCFHPYQSSQGSKVNSAHRTSCHTRWRRMLGSLNPSVLICFLGIKTASFLGFWGNITRIFDTKPSVFFVFVWDFEGLYMMFDIFDPRSNTASEGRVFLTDTHIL